jgi:hypothetical protein
MKKITMCIVRTVKLIGLGQGVTWFITQCWWEDGLLTRPLQGGHSSPV